jgi:hypothetical protein
MSPSNSASAIMSRVHAELVEGIAYIYSYLY